ncbi:MAG: LpqB family beta-propeller domain-containing protein [Acidobacteriota bacterium]
MTIAVGTRLGRYEVRSQIGEGGMGEVYLAHDTQLDRVVALKLLTAEVARDQQRLHRFLQEARAASSLSHPNVAHIYEIGEAEAAHFIAMEYVEGEPLDRKLSGRSLKVDEILEIAIQVADALDEAHAKGITHRDIKSSNIMITSRGRVKVLDFGLAKLASSPGSQEKPSGSEIATRVKTSPGIVMGTVNYMSPEQAMGREVDHRTDIFSFGVVLYEMATGRLPFAGGTITETIDRIAHTQPEAIARLNYSIPPELDVIVKKALRKDRDERYQTIHDLLVDLKDLKREVDLAAGLERSTPPASRSAEVVASLSQTALSSTSIPAAAQTGVVAAHPTSSAEYVVSGIKRHRIAVILVAVAVAFVGGLFLLFLLGLGIYKYMGNKNAGVATKGSTANMKITRLTTNGKTENAAISPDGKTVVYVVREGGQRSLWLRQVATNSNVQIVPPSEMKIGRESFSLDGNYIYYQAEDKDNPYGALFQVPALGGVPRKILSNIASPITFSPDGTRIAFIRNDNAATGEDHLIIANADGSNERKLAVRKGTTFFPASGPSWSPDGKAIASSMGSYAGGFHLTVGYVEVETGEQHEVNTKKFFDVGRVSWLADGSGVLVNAGEQGAAISQIWQISYPSGDAKAITHDLNDYAGTSLSADSKSLVTVQFNVTSNIWIAPATDLAHGRQITSGQLEGERGVAWTPDNRIVYTSLASGNLDLWIMNADGTSQKQLTSDPKPDDGPEVSPDGRYIIFNSERGALPSIWRMDIDGGNLKQITNQEDYLLDITPDGSSIIFSSWRTTRQTLWKTSIDGGEAVQISNLFITRGSLSPDGKSFACWYRDEKPNSPDRLIVLPIAGGAPTHTFDMPPTASGTPSWSPDGKAIVIYDRRTGTFNLWSQPLDGGPMKQLTDFKPDGVFARDLSPDKKTMALSRGTITSDVILISDFR